MTCASCGHANPERAKFCLECGAPVVRRCGACATELPPAAKFCLECGAPVATSGAPSEPATSGAGVPRRTRPAEPAGARKIVTIVFADLVGSTALHERLDPESARGFMEGYYAAMRGAVDAQGGSVTQLLGDGVKAMFGVPRIAEDDAIRALRAAVAMQRAFRELAERYSALVGKTGLRIAVNTGEVVVSDDSEIIGDPVNVAARLQEQGRDGDVVIGEATARLVASLVTLAPLGSFTLKGRAEPVAAFRVESLDRPEGSATAAFVGRDDELGRITRVYDATVTTPATNLVVLLGSPGLGKSRIIDEFAGRRGDRATVIAAHCNAAGGATFAPLADALRTLLGIDDGASGEALRGAIESALSSHAGDEAERARIAAGIAGVLTGSPAPPEETFFVVRRLLAALASTKPVVLVIDDLHWAEPLLLDLVEHLVQWGSNVPLLVLVGARPELRDLRSSLVMPGGLVADVVTLGGLDAGAAMRLAANVIGAADLPAAVAAKVLATSEGNPLFVGELVRMLVQEGVLTKQGERWTTGAGLASLEMPPTIHALLAARIERLRPEERGVLERAAVVGRHFSRSAVAALLPADVKDLDARLESLKRSELIEPDAGWLLGEPVLRFHHVLIRDAAYRRLLKGTRAELHARFAEWIGGRAGDAVEHDETIGWHLEQAHQHLRELGPLDERGRALGERASRHLAAAGRRALASDDVPLAAGLLGRAIATLDVADQARADLALDWCEALLAAGDVGPAGGAIEELGRFSAGSDRLRAWHACFVGQLTVLTAPQGLHATADAVAAAALELASLGDAAGEAKAHFVHALALARLGQVGACEAALDRALAAARRAGDRRRANTVLAIAPLAALWGPSPVTRASGRCLDVVRVLRITQGAPAVEAVALSCQGVLEALRGRTDPARRMIASARKMVEELGITQRLLEADAFTGFVDLLEGDAPSAERGLRGAYDGLRELGLGIDAARAAALLARALLAQGRVEEAEALSHQSEALAGDDLKAAIAWRGIRAEALARRGEHVAAVELARQAVDIAAATDALLDHADARVALAAALRAAGRTREADDEERRATELWEAKGATLLAERVRRGETRTESIRRATGMRAEPTRSLRRSVRANAATALAAQFDAAFVARDMAAIDAALISAAGVRVVDHPTESTYGHEGAVESFRRLLRLKDPVVRHEPLATLGESLGLFRRYISTGGTTGGRFDVGAYEREEFVVTEPGEVIEIFAADRLGDAIASLYGRHAALLPDGPARRRATATAGAVAAMVAPPDLDRYAAALASSVEFEDHRTVGFSSGRGATKLLRGVRSLLELASDVATRVDDVVCLEPGAILLRWTTSGQDRRGGGAFESPFLLLWIFGPEGLIVRDETFDADRGAEALARFEELTAEAATRRVRRRVNPNAGSAAMVRIEAALAARDLDAMASMIGDSFEEINHPTGTTYGREAMLSSVERFVRLPGATARHELLATLGDRLWLFRRWMGASRAGRGRFDVGEYEKEEIGFNEIDDEGRARRNEIFAADRLGGAIARLYERYAELLPAGPARDRASATARSVDAMTGWLDQDRMALAVAPTIEVVDRRILGTWSARGADALLQHVDAWLEVGQAHGGREDDVLALRSDGLLLRRTFSGIDREGGGTFDGELIVLWAFGSDGRATNWEMFDADRELEALARFDEIYAGDPAIPPAEAPGRIPPNRASRLREQINQALLARDWHAMRALASAEMTYEDRRHLAMTSGGIEMWLASSKAVQSASGIAFSDEVIAAVGERIELRRRILTGIGPDGGAFESEFLLLTEVDVDGKLVASINFDVEARADASIEAQKRFLARETVTTGSRERFANAATASAAPVVRCMIAHDWQGFAQLFAEDFQMSDRRRVVQLELDRDQYVAFTREVADGRTVRNRWELVATRGDRLAVTRAFYEFTDADVGPSEIAFLILMEVDERGRIVANVRWDVEDLDAAYAELDARWAAGEATADPLASKWLADYLRFFAARDWNAMTAIMAADFVGENHRLVGWGTLCGAAALVSTLQAQIELAPDTQERVDHVRTCARGVLFEYAWHGTREGGAFENMWIVLIELDADGRACRGDVWEAEQLEQARARFAALCSNARPDPFAAIAKGNAATAAIDRWQVFDTGAEADWSALRATCAPDLIFEDRQGFAQIEGDRELMIASLRERATSGARVERRVMGTAGERVAVTQMLWSGGPSDGRFEIEYLSVVEVDASGLLVAVVLFGADDARAAQREAWARWVGIDPRVEAPVSGLAEFIDAWNAQDRSRLRAPLADGVVVEDHRRTGLGRVEGAEAYVDSVAALWQLAPQSQFEAGWFWLAAEAHGGLWNARRWGPLAEGSAFESDFLVLTTLARGRTTRIEVFELEQLDAARARFEELRPPPLLDLRKTDPDPLRVPPNAASRASDRHWALAEAGEWDAVQALHAPSLVFDDRRQGLRTTADRVAYLAGLRWGVGDLPLHVKRTLLATAGDRAELRHNRFTRTAEVLLFEIETLCVTEVDADGRLVAVVLFDPADRAAAQAELVERFFARAAGEMPIVAVDFLRAVNARDLDRVRAVLLDDFVFDDRRRAGLGRIDGSAAYERALTAMWALSHDVRLEQLYEVASAPHGRLIMGRTSGTNLEGGEFESVYVSLVHVAGGRLAGIELFEPEDLDAALARFEELRPEPLCTAPNAATGNRPS